MNNQFIDQLSGNIKFNYTCFDRVIVRGYITHFFSLGRVVIFLKAMGFSKIHSGILRIFTDQLNSHIKKVAEKSAVPIIWWPAVGGGKNGAKQQYVEQEYSRDFKGNGNHVYCIITDKELAQTVSSKELTSKKGRKYTSLYKCSKPIKHYYIYLHDAELGGPCYLKISSYLPFHSEFYFNGHNFIKRKLDEKGISYRMKDNAFVDIADPAVLEQIAKDIKGNVIQERINFWMNHFFRFDKGKYSTRSAHLQHEWYLSQVEICSNVIFKSSRFCTSLFERLLDKFSRIGLPDSIAKIFSKRVYRSKSKSIVRLYDNNACLKHWFRRNSIKQYNKSGSLIRTETTINNPKALGLKKPVLYLQSYFWFGLGCNDRLLDCCADVDLSSLNSGEADIFSKPVLDHRDRKITPPDLRKDRQIVLFEELLKPKYSIYGFKTADLAKVLSDHFRNSTQIRYELKKLIVRGVVKKRKNKSFYGVTNLGYKWLWVSISSKRYFENPMISKGFKNDVKQSVTQPSIFEKGYDLINRGLDHITRELALI